jgi:GT2 family glycosyltransferase
MDRRQSERNRERVAAVVGTRNRLELLKSSIRCIRMQTRAPDVILVIDNQSDDGTAEWLASQDDIVVHTQDNLGSSGGQLRGIKEAHQAGCDWFWCMDDDTLPEPEALERLLASKAAADERVGFINSLALWKDGSRHRMNVPSIHADPDLIIDGLSHGMIPIENSSFVSMLVRRAAVDRCGLPLREFFIWYDDAEFTRRLRKEFLGYLVPASRVLHATPENHSSDLSELNEGNAWKFRYAMRNRMYFEMTSGGPLHYRLRKSLRLAWSYYRVIHSKVSLPTALTLGRSLLEGMFLFRPKIEFP